MGAVRARQVEQPVAAVAAVAAVATVIAVAAVTAVTAVAAVGAVGAVAAVAAESQPVARPVGGTPVPPTTEPKSSGEELEKGASGYCAGLIMAYAFRQDASQVPGEFMR